MSEVLSDFDYELPPELIAQHPVSPRDSSRLLVLNRKERKLEHRKFSDLVEYLDDRDLLVANNTRVIQARLEGRRLRQEAGKWIPGGRVEFVLLEKQGDCVWEGLFHASAKYVPGLRFEVPTPDGKGLFGELVRGSADSPSGTVVARFNRDPLETKAGKIPLPHYIERPSDPTAADESAYQTIYGKNDGSAAAPTAGLHFTDQVFERLKQKKIGWEELTLHVGLGTFRPVKTEDLSKHVMHDERYEVSSSAADRITRWKKDGNRVLAVGTTSVRTLESAWHRDHLASGFGRTDLFIRPGHFEFQVVDRLLTNFHLPKSTLLMLVSAFAGREFVLEAYREAVRNRYRFFSFGDSMLIL
ncbi:MAG: tRNA preQ1(34) S-adenosylmethionine ribosyltransferase-isomerase QueA [Bdellovibrio sp.]|nr:tRNA preQ1(34) S-adenosylmethionine ribosyltransferase-isomerase QueA [Bdellovibrio sp.]